MLNSWKKLKYSRHIVNVQAILTIAIIVAIKSNSRDKGSRNSNILGAQKNLIFSGDGYVGGKELMQRSFM